MLLLEVVMELPITAEQKHGKRCFLPGIATVAWLQECNTKKLVAPACVIKAYHAHKPC